LLKARRKNIKIAPAIGGARPQKRISFSLFAPFIFLWFDSTHHTFSEAEGKSQCQKNQKVTKIRQRKHALSQVEGSTSVPSVDPWFVLYKLAKPFFFTAFQVELAE